VKTINPGNPGPFTPPSATHPRNDAVASAAAAAVALANAAARRAGTAPSGTRTDVATRYHFAHTPLPRTQPPRNNLPLRRAPPRPAAQRAARSTSAQDPNQMQELDRADDTEERGIGQRPDDDERRRKPGKDAAHADERERTRHDLGDAREQPEDRERQRRPLNARTPPRRTQPPATQVLARSGLPEAGALFVRQMPGARDPKDMLNKLAAALLAVASNTGKLVAPKPTPAATMLAALQVHMASQRESAPEPMTLGDVKALLMSLPQPPAGAADLEQAQNLCLMLPLLLLNATRPRTDAQRGQAMERLQHLRSGKGLS